MKKDWPSYQPDNQSVTSQPPQPPQPTQQTQAPHQRMPFPFNQTNPSPNMTGSVNQVNYNNGNNGNNGNNPVKGQNFSHLPTRSINQNQNQNRRKLDNFLNMDIDKINIIPYQPSNKVMESKPPPELPVYNNYGDIQTFTREEKKNNIYYLCGIDHNIIFILAKFLSRYGICYSIHSRVPPTEITFVKGRHFTNIIDKDDTSVKRIVIFVYNDPIKCLTAENIWTVSHCSDIMYPESADTVFQTFQNESPNVIDYLKTNQDWLKLEQFYDNYLKNDGRSNYPIVAVNTDKLWDNLKPFAEVLQLPPNSINSFPRKPNIKSVSEACTLYDNLNAYLNTLPVIKIINAREEENISVSETTSKNKTTTLKGNFTAKLGKKNKLKFKINSETPIHEPLNIKLWVEKQDIKESKYDYSYDIEEQQRLTITIFIRPGVEQEQDDEVDKQPLHISYMVN